MNFFRPSLFLIIFSTFFFSILLFVSGEPGSASEGDKEKIISDDPGLAPIIHHCDGCTPGEVTCIGESRYKCLAPCIVDGQKDETKGNWELDACPTGSVCVTVMNPQTEQQVSLCSNDLNKQPYCTTDVDTCTSSGSHEVHKDKGKRNAQASKCADGETCKTNGANSWCEPKPA